MNEKEKIKQEFTECEKEVKAILEKHPETRDSYEMLFYWYIVDKFGIKNTTIAEMMKKYFEGIVFSTVGRSRRRVQQFHKELRGEKRIKREERAYYIAQNMKEGDNDKV